MTFDRSGWLVEIDPEATATAYALQVDSFSERCGCVGCRNFVAVRENVFSTEVRAFLATLGIDYRKEADASQLGPPQDDLYQYSGWFNLVGRVFKDPGDMAVLNPRFKFFFIAGGSGEPMPAAENLLRLEFELLAPWAILPKPEADE